MARARFILRVLLVATIAIVLGYWAGSTTMNLRERQILAEYHAQELTEIPEYQGIGAGILLWGGIAFVLAAAATNWAAWRVTATLSTQAGKRFSGDGA